ncbi:MAG: hypothetical protein AAGD00_02565 [Planctomycetota bacterium]
MTRGNPDFDLSIADAQRDLARMRRDRKPLTRPIVCIAGWRAWPLLARHNARVFRSVFACDASRVLPVSYFSCGSFESAARHSVSRVVNAWGEHDGETVEVDVIAVSMGGLLSRFASLPSTSAALGIPRLRVHRLFTLATPHRGAQLARWIALDSAARDMKPGSDRLAQLDAALERGEGVPRDRLTPYGRTRDVWVGAKQTAPPGVEPMWVRTPWWSLGHLMVSTDARLLADAARRLRGEEPFARAGGPPSGN